MMLVLSDAYRRQYGFDSCAPIVANLYGPDDNFDLESSHVIAAMIRKYVEAHERGDEQVVLWGTGKPSREFLYVDDAARALAARRRAPRRLRPGQHRHRAPRRNIRTLAETIERLVGYEGETVWDASRPDGQPTRSLDVSRARELMGFEARVPLEEGLRRTIESFRAQHVDRVMSAPRALITGVAGQDGSYLAELLLERGYEVFGIVRGSPLARYPNLAGVQRRHPPAAGRPARPDDAARRDHARRARRALQPGREDRELFHSSALSL